MRGWIKFTTKSSFAGDACVWHSLQIPSVVCLLGTASALRWFCHIFRMPLCKWELLCYCLPTNIIKVMLQIVYINRSPFTFYNKLTRTNLAVVTWTSVFEHWLVFPTWEEFMCWAYCTTCRTNIWEWEKHHDVSHQDANLKVQTFVNF